MKSHCLLLTCKWVGCKGIIFSRTGFSKICNSLYMVGGYLNMDKEGGAGMQHISLVELSFSEQEQIDSSPCPKIYWSLLAAATRMQQAKPLQFNVMCWWKFRSFVSNSPHVFFLFCLSELLVMLGTCPSLMASLGRLLRNWKKEGLGDMPKTGNQSTDYSRKCLGSFPLPWSFPPPEYCFWKFTPSCWNCTG